MQTIVLSILDIMEWLDYHAAFDIKRLFNDLDIRNTKLNREFCEKVLDYNKIAYKFRDVNIWRSRANFFNNRRFSVTLTKMEQKKEIFIPGSRFAPYTNHFFRYRHLNLKYKGKQLKPKPFPLTLKEVKEYYYLCSERELLSILESIDPQNTVIDGDSVDDDYIFYVPAYNISRFYSDFSFSEEDQIVFKVLDWGQVSLELKEKTDRTIGKIYKKKWISKFDELLQKTAVSRPSENYSIEDIIASMIEEDPALFFHDKYFVSIESHLKESQVLETIDFGVKEKIWPKNSPIVLSDEWFNYVYGIPNILQVSNEEDDFLCSIGSPMSLNIIRFAVYSFLDENYVKLHDNPEDTQNNCVESIFKEFFSWKKYEAHSKKLLTLIKKEYQRNVKKFNPFKDSDMIDLVLTVFQLFRRMFSIVSYSEEKKLLPDKIDFNVVIMLNQFAEDLNPLLRMTGELLDSSEKESAKETKQKRKEVAIIRDKFDNFLDNVEEYIFSTF